MSQFPDAIPTAHSFSSVEYLSNMAGIGHIAVTAFAEAELIAIATKVGTGSSTPTNNKVLRGNGTGTSIWAQVDLTTDVTGTLPIANGGTGATTLTSGNYLLGAGSSAITSKTPANVAIELLPYIYPVGCIYFSTNSTNPATSLGFGTWTAFGAGRVPVGFDSGQTEFDVDEETGGAKTHTLTTAEMPAHTHGPDNTAYLWNASGAAIQFAAGAFGVATSAQTASAGGGGAHNNLQPYIVVRMWKRTA